MRSVRMKFSYIGYRYVGGPKWPPFNGILETSDEEADLLVACGNAVYLEDEPEPEHPGFAPMRKWTEDYEPALDPDNYRTEDPDLTEYEAEEEEAPGPKRPATYAKKEDWITYAVTIDGEGVREVSERMTKADLISKYGASL